MASELPPVQSVDLDDPDLVDVCRERGERRRRLSAMSRSRVCSVLLTLRCGAVDELRLAFEPYLDVSVEQAQRFGILGSQAAGAGGKNP